MCTSQFSCHSSDNEFRPNFGNTELFYFSDLFFFVPFYEWGGGGVIKKNIFGNTNSSK